VAAALQLPPASPGQISARPNQCTQALLQEHQFQRLGVAVDGDQVTEIDLAGRQQIGERKHQMPLNGALQVPRSESRVSAFL
jgi:hypothetical protein